MRSFFTLSISLALAGAPAWAAGPAVPAGAPGSDVTVTAVPVPWYTQGAPGNAPRPTQYVQGYYINYGAPAGTPQYQQAPSNQTPAAPSSAPAQTRQVNWVNTSTPVVSAAPAGGPAMIPPCCPQAPAPQQAAPAPTPVTTPEQPQAAEAPATDSFAQAPEAGTEAAASFNPQMIGDLLGFSSCIQVPVTSTSSGTSRTIRVPISAGGAFKISENESPRPQNRVYGGYNYFNNVNGSFRGDVSAFDVHRQLIGVEKTFMHGDASIGLRLPFVEFAGDKAVENTTIDDLSVIFKYACYNNCRTHDVISTGLLLTVPTGESFQPCTGGSSIHPMIFLPYVGYIYNMDRFYVHGFLSVETSTDLRIPTVLFNDIGLGFWLYRVQKSQLLTSIVPTVEAHVNTPLSKRGVLQEPVGLTDQIILTGGLHFTMFQRATLTVGASAPVTGPQPFDLEAFAQFNFRF